MNRPQAERPPDWADIAYTSIPKIVHYALGAAGAVGGGCYAFYTHAYNPGGWIIGGFLAGWGVFLALWMGYQVFKMAVCAVILAIVFYFLVYGGLVVPNYHGAHARPREALGRSMGR